MDQYRCVVCRWFMFDLPPYEWICRYCTGVDSFKIMLEDWREGWEGYEADLMAYVVKHVLEFHATKEGRTWPRIMF